MQDLKDVTRDIHYETYRARYINDQMRQSGRDRKYVPFSHILLFVRLIPWFSRKVLNLSSSKNPVRFVFRRHVFLFILLFLTRDNSSFVFAFYCAWCFSFACLYFALLSALVSVQFLYFVVFRFLVVRQNPQMWFWTTSKRSFPKGMLSLFLKHLTQMLRLRENWKMCSISDNNKHFPCPKADQPLSWPLDSRKLNLVILGGGMVVLISLAFFPHPHHPKFAVSLWLFSSLYCFCGVWCLCAGERLSLQKH